MLYLAGLGKACPVAAVVGGVGDGLERRSAARTFRAEGRLRASLLAVNHALEGKV